MVEPLMSEADRADAIRFYNGLAKPVLVLSSRAGRGNTSIAEAICEHFLEPASVVHRSIEDFLPPAIVAEDLSRYRVISDHFPLLLAAMYKIPFFYARKLEREKRRTTRLGALERFLSANGIRTIVCVSHRQAFWAAVVKRNTGSRIALHGVLTEFGPTPGWKYVFWDQIDGFVSPLPADALGDMLPSTVPVQWLALPARAAFYALPRVSAPQGQCLLMGGLWGQGRLEDALQLLVTHFPQLGVQVVCGDNDRLARKLKARFGHRPTIAVHGLVDALAPLLARCSSVVTKPGMGTLLEARAARRKIFLFPGMPVAEDQNARHAIAHFGAEWLTVTGFERWLHASARE
jgi:hypothetical protein